VTIGKPAEYRQKLARLSAGQELQRTHNTTRDYRIVGTIPEREPRTNPADIWGIEHREATEHERAALAAETEMLEEAWQAVLAERAALPRLLDRAITDGYVDTAKSLQERKSVIDGDTARAELEYQQARVRWYFAEKSHRLAERSRALRRCSRPTTGDETAADVAERTRACRTYHTIRVSGVDDKLPEALGRIERLVEEIRG
jgi:hypothetical protein